MTRAEKIISDAEIAGASIPMDNRYAFMFGWLKREVKKLEKLLTEKDAAEILNVKPVTLQTWRSNKIGPPFVKFKTGGIRYKEADLEVWASVSNQKIGGKNDN